MDSPERLLASWLVCLQQADPLVRVAATSHNRKMGRNGRLSEAGRYTEGNAGLALQQALAEPTPACRIWRKNVLVNHSACRNEGIIPYSFTSSWFSISSWIKGFIHPNTILHQTTIYEITGSRVLIGRTRWSYQCAHRKPIVSELKFG
jgi:hypothetical protein